MPMFKELKKDDVLANYIKKNIPYSIDQDETLQFLQIYDLDCENLFRRFKDMNYQQFESETRELHIGLFLQIYSAIVCHDREKSDDQADEIHDLIDEREAMIANEVLGEIDKWNF